MPLFIIFFFFLFGFFSTSYAVPPINLADNTARSLGSYTCKDPAGYTGAGGQCKGIADYSGMGYDKTTQRAYLYGGGHATTPRTDTDEFWFSDMKWGHGNVSTPCADMTDANWNSTQNVWNTTLQPYASHSYDGINVANGELIILKRQDPAAAACFPANWQAIQSSSGRAQHQNLTTHLWTQGPVFSLASYGATEYDPLSNSIILVYSDSGLWTYDVTLKQLTKRVSWIKPIGYANNLVNFPPNGKMYFIARATPSTVWELSLNRANWSQSVLVQVTGITGTSPGSAESGYDYDSVNRIICGGISAGKIYCYNPLTKNWEVKTMALEAGSAGPIGSMTPMHTIKYAEDLNVFIFIANQGNLTTNKTWLWRNKNVSVALPADPTSAILHVSSPP